MKSWSHMTPMEKKLGRLGIVFKLAMCAGLGWFAFMAFEAARTPSDIQIPSMVVAVLAGVGFFVFLSRAIGEFKEQKEIDDLQQRHPDAPWMWRADWAAAAIRSSSRGEVTKSWAIVVGWFVLSFLLVPLFQRLFEDETLPLLVALLMGTICVLWAAVETVRFRKVGTSVLRLSTLPGAIGGSLSGSIELPRTLGKAGTVVLRLTCIRRTETGSGDSRSVGKEILWQDEDTRSFEQLETRPAGVAIPITFRIPAECLATDDRDSSETIYWRLDADAKLPGFDYSSGFIVPVFQIEGREERIAKEEPAHDRTVIPPFPAEGSTVVVRPAETGGTVFFFPGGQARGTAAWLSFVAILWGAFGWFLHWGWTIPLSVTIGYALVTLLILIPLINLWFGSSTISVEPSSVTIRKGVIVFPRLLTIPRKHIAEIHMELVTPLIRPSGTRGACYQVVLVMGSSHTATSHPILEDGVSRLASLGAAVVLGKPVARKHEAEWLVAKMQDILGLHARLENGLPKPSTTEGRLVENR